jgi:hypothetical protein
MILHTQLDRLGVELERSLSGFFRTLSIHR